MATCNLSPQGACPGWYNISNAGLYVAPQGTTGLTLSSTPYAWQSVKIPSRAGTGVNAVIGGTTYWWGPPIGTGGTWKPPALFADSNFAADWRLDATNGTAWNLGSAFAYLLNKGGALTIAPSGDPLCLASQTFLPVATAAPKKKETKWIIIGAVAGGVVLLLLLIWLLMRKKE